MGPIRPAIVTVSHSLQTDAAQPGEYGSLVGQARVSGAGRRRLPPRGSRCLLSAANHHGTERATKAWACSGSGCRLGRRGCDRNVGVVAARARVANLVRSVCLHRVLMVGIHKSREAACVGVPGCDRLWRAAATNAFEIAEHVVHQAGQFNVERVEVRHFDREDNVATTSRQ